MRAEARMPGDFLDSNVLVYAFTDDLRAPTAQALLERGCRISVQGLNEFTNVARRKLGKSWAEIRSHIAAIRTVCPLILPISVATHEAAVQLAERYGFAMFDALVVASALEAQSATLWSEDMQDGMMVEGRLRIADPFRTR